MDIGAICSIDLTSVNAQASLREALALMHSQHGGALVVSETGPQGGCQHVVGMGRALVSGARHERRTHLRMAKACIRSGTAVGQSASAAAMGKDFPENSLSCRPSLGAVYLPRRRRSAYPAALNQRMALPGL